MTSYAAVHFGAGNIGRGFIGETLNKSGFSVQFVDVNAAVIDELNARGTYDITLANPTQDVITIDNVSGINNGTDPEKVVDAIAEADLVTTAIGPNILKFIAPLIAQGIEARALANVQTELDVIAAENMIGGSDALKVLVYDALSDNAKTYADTHVGFPNSAVDRIVPEQSHEDVLAVTVEQFKEWVIDSSQAKRTDIVLEEVHYTDNLEAFIERKLFSVNTGHATVAYAGAELGFTTVQEALQDKRVKVRLEKVLAEIRSLLLDKWGFDEDDLRAYHQILTSRFANPQLSDSLSRVGRTPIRKLGYDERFIRPIRELKARDLEYDELIKSVVAALHFNIESDEESQTLQARLQNEDVRAVLADVTKLEDDALLDTIVAAYNG